MNILELAKQAGVLAGYEGEPDKLERFAALIRAEERGRCAAKCEQNAARSRRSRSTCKTEIERHFYDTFQAAQDLDAAEIRGMGDE